MRTFFTSFWSFWLSFFAGGLIVQLIAEKTNATEEFILAFMSFALLLLIVTGVFFAAQLMSNPLSAVSTVAKFLLVVLAVLGVTLLAFSFWADGAHAPRSKETWLLIAMIIPPFVLVLVQWWFVRWRLRRVPLHSGSNPA